MQISAAAANNNRCPTCNLSKVPPTATWSNARLLCGCASILTLACSPSGGHGFPSAADRQWSLITWTAGNQLAYRTREYLGTLSGNIWGAQHWYGLPWVLGGAAFSWRADSFTPWRRGNVLPRNLTKDCRYELPTWMSLLSRKTPLKSVKFATCPAIMIDFIISCIQNIEQHVTIDVLQRYEPLSTEQLTL